jgi:hypothetical protein
MARTVAVEVPAVEVIGLELMIPDSTGRIPWGHPPSSFLLEGRPDGYDDVAAGANPAAIPKSKER